MKRSANFKKSSSRGGAPQSSSRANSKFDGSQRGASASKAAGSSPRRPEDVIAKTDRVAIGIHAVKEALSTVPKKCQALWLRQGFESSAELKDIKDFAEARKVAVEVKSPTALERFGSHHQGLALVIRGAPELNFDQLESHAQSQVLFLDGIEDPHNLGAILRTSWLMGCHGVVIPADRAVGLSPVVHKVACGGVEHVPVYQDNNFSNHIEKLKQQGYWVFGLSHKANKSLHEMKFPEKVVWMIGAEDKGLRGNSERLCDELVSIPQVSAGASYNASVAAALALFETSRQHLQQSQRK